MRLSAVLKITSPGIFFFFFFFLSFLLGGVGGGGWGGDVLFVVCLFTCFCTRNFSSKFRSVISGLNRDSA